MAEIKKRAKQVKREDRIGETFEGSKGSKWLVVGVSSKANCLIVESELGTIKVVEWHKRHKVKCVYTPSVFDIGFIGDTQSMLGCGIGNRSYETWKRMIERCYSGYKQHKSYANAIVCEEWLNFTVFEAWFNDNYIEGFELDKDLLSGGLKYYSPETCVFIPTDINTLLQHSGSIHLEDNVRQRLLPHYREGRLSLEVCRLIMAEFKSKEI